MLSVAHDKKLDVVPPEREEISTNGRLSLFFWFFSPLEVPDNESGGGLRQRSPVRGDPDESR